MFILDKTKGRIRTMKVFINPGHDIKYDSGAVHSSGMREADVVSEVGKLVKHYLDAVGYETYIMQSDNLYYDSSYPDRQTPVVVTANSWDADVFVSIHCNAAGNLSAHGTEVECYRYNSPAASLAQCIQDQIVNSIGTVDRGVKEMPGLIVLKHTDMPAVLVEMAFISNDDDASLLACNQDDFARAIARGISDYAATL